MGRALKRDLRTGLILALFSQVDLKQYLKTNGGHTPKEEINYKLI